MTDKRLTPEELTAYLHRIQFGNHEASQWAATQIADHIAALTSDLDTAIRERDQALSRPAVNHVLRLQLEEARAESARLRTLVSYADSVFSEDRVREEALCYAAFGAYLDARKALGEAK